MVTVYPDARFLPLGAETQDPLQVKNIVCVHTMVGYLISTDRYFRIGNGEGYRGTESHFGIGGKWGPDLNAVGGSLDGVVYQWQDLDFQADANYLGNGEVISIETADNAERPIEPWTTHQLSSLVKLCVWLCNKYSIPPSLIPDTRPGRRGLAYHAQGAAERVPGGVQWSTTPSKDCPTAERIRQFRDIVVPTVARVMNGDDDSMAADPEVLQALHEIRDEMKGLYAAGFAARTPSGAPDPTHEEISVRGVNVELNKTNELLTEIRDLLKGS